jgi:ribosome-associated protein
MENLKINTEYIKLDQFLKWAGISSMGSESKIYITEGKVKVNGQVELQRGKKLRKGDIVEFESKSFQID